LSSILSLRLSFTLISIIKPYKMNPTYQIDDKRSAQIFVFGDQTIPFEHALRHLLHVKNDGILTAFFDKVALNLRRYLGNLPANQQDWFPSFTTLVDLAAQYDDFNGAPVLKFALLCATEIALFIR
jgi:naphtho-gamma-pyrone polyketide synthase